ncbi:MAG: recombinase family protein [Oscillospiraceae bacterium]
MLPPNWLDYRWTYKAVVRILRNEKYIGDSLWQKTFQTDDLPRHKKTIRGKTAILCC